HMATDFRGQIGRVLMKLLQLDRQQGEPLTDIVVQLPGNPRTFLLLCLNQPAAYACESRFRQFALRDIDKCDHCPNYFLSSSLWIRPIFRRETCSVRPPQYLVVRVDSFPSSCYLVNSTLLHRKQRPIRTSVMHQIMRILAEHFVESLISQSAEACWVAKRTAVFEINSINGFGGRVEKKTEFILAFAQCLFRLLQFCQVDRCPHGSARHARLIQQGNCVLH